jgi:predicted membrane-bound mannosyltransferase
MNNPILTWAKKNWVSLVLLVVIAGGVFVRTYKFDDWLYFKMDQSRDAILMSKSINEGPQYLPLLGARAGAVKLKHGFLRLGPAFYYFEYVAGKLFNSTEPYVLAYPDLFFGILAIPMLFFLAKLYFSRLNSLLIATMYAFSFIIIQYSRFSWNPNALQFFLLLSFYGLLRMLNEPNEKKRRWWIALWAFAATIGSQLHFFGFFTLLGASGLLIGFHHHLWKLAKIKTLLQREMLKKMAGYAAIALAVFLFLYTPVIISDVFKKGENTHNFFEAMGSKPSKDSFGEKIFKDVKENAKYYCLVTTSQCYGSSIKKEVPALLVTGLVLLAGLSLSVRGLRKKTNLLQRDFLAMLLIWVGVFSILTIPVAFQLRPRFFIVVFAIPFIFLGLAFEFFEEKLKKEQAIALAILFTVGIVAWNSHGTYAWFKEQASSQKKALEVKRTLILKAKDGVTLSQLQGVTDWMYGRRKEGWTLYYYVKPEHVRPIDFLLLEKKDKNLNFVTMRIDQNPKAQFFAITPAKNGLDDVYAKYGRDVAVIASQQFGQLTVYEINFTNRVVSADFKFKKSKDSEDRIYWKDVANIFIKK